MGILDKAKEHFQGKLSGEPKSIDVPEWGMIIFYKPMSLRTKGELNKYAENPFEYAARALISRSLNEDGDRIFKGVNFTEIMREVDPSVVERVVLAMAESEDSADIEGN